MKTAAWILALTVVALGACTSQQKSTGFVNDEVYNSPVSTASVAEPAGQQGAQVIENPDKATSQKPPASSTFEEDYNDYSYASRIKRFGGKDTTAGYFDESYAGGSSSGSGPNVSFNFGIGTGFGYYDPFWGYPYYGYGYPSYGWGYPYYGWGYPYYGWGYPWYSPWYGYGYGCCCCYYDYYTPYYADTYYGPRNPLTTTDGTGRSNTTRNSVENTNADYQRNVKETAPLSRPGSGTTAATAERSAVERTTTGPATTESAAATRSTPASQATYRYTRPATDPSSAQQRTTPPKAQGAAARTETRQQPAPRYIRPENATPVQRSGETQSYTSPVYRQPKTSSEYLAPRTQNASATRTGSQGSEQSGYNRSTRQTQTQTGVNRQATPTQRSESPRYSTPSRTNQNYSTPSRSSGSGTYSAPSRSGNSSSAPSGGSNYSAPSRSGGSSTPAGSSGGGGRRR